MHLLGRTICGFDSAKYSDAKGFAPVVFKLAEDAYDAGVTFKKK